MRKILLTCPKCYDEAGDEIHNAGCTKEVIAAFRGEDVVSLNFVLDCENCNTLHYFEFDRDTKKVNLVKSVEKGTSPWGTKNIR